MPRPAVIAMLGEENQGCPVLILNREHDPLPDKVKTANGHRFIAGPRGIAAFLASAYGASHSH